MFATVAALQKHVAVVYMQACGIEIKERNGRPQYVRKEILRPT